MNVRMRPSSFREASIGRCNVRKTTRRAAGKLTSVKRADRRNTTQKAMMAKKPMKAKKAREAFGCPSLTVTTHPMLT